MPRRPEWWSWEVELSPHLLKRMIDRRFNEVDLRLMFERASGYRIDVQPGRWVIETGLEGRRWEIIVEPEPADRILIVISAYPT